MIYQGDALQILKTLPDESVNCVVTSPPYYGLRDYGTATWIGGDEKCDHKEAKEKSRYDYKMQEGSRHAQIAENTFGTDGARWKGICPKCGALRQDQQIGLEETPEIYVQKLIEVFSEVKRVLKDDGTLWLNLGDSYSAHKDCKSISQTIAQGTSRENAHQIPKGLSRTRDSKMLKSIGLKNKDLIGIPWRVAFALQADGWYLRQDIIWHKPNPMPESVTDRCTKAHEYIFLLAKSQKYYFDNEVIKENTTRDWSKTGGNLMGKGIHKQGGSYKKLGNRRCDKERYGRNKRSVWTVTTKSFKGAHFAVFPEDLIIPCVLAGCPKGGVVLDPFMGSGTTGVVAQKLEREFIGIELNPKYIEIAKKRLEENKVLWQAS